MTGQRHDAEIGLEGGERVVGDLGPGRGNDRQQRALAGVRLTNQAHVGDELEDQLDFPVLALLARLPFAGSLMR
jgi:hypothetical protein